MKENSFTTQTDAKYVERQKFKTIAIVFVVLSLFACFGFLIAWQTFVFFESIIFFSCVACVRFGKINQSSYLLQFENDRLFITNQTTGEMFEVYDIPASDLVINQTKEEKRTDYCSLMIKKTVFAFGGVERCSELKRYISENYK